MRVFRKNYIIDLKETSLNLELLGINDLEQLYNLEFEIFRISTLGFFNKVVAKFEKLESKNQLLLKIELPKKLYYLQLIPIALFIVIGFAIIFSEEHKSSQTSEYFVYFIPVIIIIMGLIYQQEFLKESKSFLNKITRTNINKE